MTIACGNKVHRPEALEPFGARQHHHETVAQVRSCFAGRPVPSVEETAVDENDEANGLAEFEAEARNERFFEERGVNTYAGSEEEARDRYFDGLNWEAAVATEEHPQFQTVGNCPNYVLPPNWRDGVYTTETDSGHRTFRFRTQQSGAKFKPGVQLVAYLNGPNNDFAYGDYVQFGEVTPAGTKRGATTVWKKYRDNKALEADYLAFLANPAAALAAVHCYRCHALLTVPESIAAGWGPHCLKKGLR